MTCLPQSKTKLLYFNLMSLHSTIVPFPSSYDDLFNAAQLAIDSALANPELQDYLTPFGYPPDELSNGRALYDAAFSAHSKQKQDQAEQLGATAELDRLREAVNKTYIRHVKLARVAFKKETVAVAKLALSGERKRSFTGWLGQVQQFYTALAGDTQLQQRLERFGVTADLIAQVQADIQAVIEANVTRETERGEAQQATKDRDAALDALLDWHSDFIAVARIALEEKPQLLETLGIRVAS